MDYFDTNHIDLSVRDVFESEVQTEMDQILRSGSAGYDPQTETIDLTGYSPNENSDLVGNFTAESAAMQDMIWLPTTLIEDGIGTLSNTITTTTSSMNSNLAFSHLSSPEKFALDGQGLLVNPQTGQPVSTLNFVLGLQQHNQSIIQQQVHQQQLEQGQSMGNLATHGIDTATSMNFTNGQQQRFLSLTPQQLRQNGTMAVQPDQQQSNQVSFQAVPVIGLQQANGNPSTNAISSQHQTASSLLSKQHKLEPIAGTEQKVYPKPAYSYSCLITMAMKNSKTGCMPVSDIYQFMW